jgi:hypothetical protein
VYRRRADRRVLSATAESGLGGMALNQQSPGKPRLVQVPLPTRLLYAPLEEALSHYVLHLALPLPTR